MGLGWRVVAFVWVWRDKNAELAIGRLLRIGEITIVEF